MQQLVQLTRRRTTQRRGLIDHRSLPLAKDTLTLVMGVARWHMMTG